MPEYRIPFNRPGLVGDELRYVAEAIARGHSAGDGEFTRRCQTILERELQAKRVLLTTSCTHALEMAALLLDLKPGDEFIVPSFTFVSTANAFVLRGARPVFADIRPDTLNIDEQQIEPLITPRTKLIVPVHYAGVGCEMDTILEIARRRGLDVVEDNAHGLFGQYNGRPLGSFGAMATQSFHETKNIICGEGGALVINEEQFIGRAEVLREKGTDRRRFLEGQLDKYSWVDIGSSFSPSDILAAFLCAQLEKRAQIEALRCRVWHYYYDHLHEWALSNGVGIPAPPGRLAHSYHMFYLMMPSLQARDAMIARLKQRGILSVFHYVPLHTSEMGLRFGGQEGQCPVTERVSRGLLRLPFYNALSESEQAEIVSLIRGFRVD